MNANYNVSQIEKIYNPIKSLLSKKGKSQEIERIDKLIKDATSDEVSILVCGEFKRGKSSFINSFLNTTVCPVDKGIATSVVSIIKYGKEQKITRYYGDIRNLASEEIPFDKIETYAKGTSFEVDNTVYLAIELPNERLKKGITIIDTPGVGGLDPRHLYLTLAFLPKADICFFMLDVGEPMSSSEMSFYKERILAYSKQSVILLNKTDTKRNDEVEQFISDAKNKIYNECDSSINIDIIPLSSLHWAMNNSNPSERMKISSNCEQVNALIDAIAKKHRENRLLSVKNYLISVLEKTLEPITFELEQLANPNNEDIQEFKDKLSDLKKCKDDLSQPNSEYRKKITSIVRKTQNDVNADLNRQSVLFSSECLDTLLKRSEATASNGDEWVLNQINIGLESLAVEVDMKIDAGFEKINDILGGVISYDNSGFDKIVFADLSKPERSLADSACKFTRQALPGLGVATLAGVVLSGIFTGGAAWIAGLGALAAAGGFVYKNNKDTNIQVRIMDMRTKLQPQITIAMHDLKQYVQSRFDDFNERLVSELEMMTSSIVADMQDIVEFIQLTDKDEKLRLEKQKALSDQSAILQSQIQLAKIFMSNPFGNN